MKKSKWGNAENNINFSASVVKRFMPDSEFKIFCENYASTRCVRPAWEASKEDWEFNKKYPNATIDIWAERWGIHADSAWKRLGKMYLLGRNKATR